MITHLAPQFADVDILARGNLAVDEIRDIAIRIVDQMVLEKLLPDCIDTDDNTEFDVQDIIVEQLENALKEEK